MRALFQHIIHATRINSIARGNIVLELAQPMTRPDIDSVIIREAIEFGFRSVNDSANCTQPTQTNKPRCPDQGQPRVVRVCELTVSVGLNQALKGSRAGSS